MEMINIIFCYSRLHQSAATDSDCHVSVVILLWLHALPAVLFTLPLSLILVYFELFRLAYLLFLLCIAIKEATITTYHHHHHLLLLPPSASLRSQRLNGSFSPSVAPSHLPLDHHQSLNYSVLSFLFSNCITHTYMHACMQVMEIAST